jgi:glycosyltransferase involved in cell wall biosynthesis
MARELGAGGSERQLAEIAKNLDRQHFAPQVGFFRPGIRSEELAAAGVPCHQFDVRSFGTPAVFRKATEFCTFLQEQEIQIVHTFDYPLTCFAVPVARAYGVPVVLSSQRGHRRLIPGLYRDLVRVTDLLVDGIVVNCRAMERHLVEEEEIAHRKIHLCYNGIDPSLFLHPSRSIDHSGDKQNLTIGCVCVFRPEKNLHLLLEAAAPLCRTNPSLQLLLVGSGPEKQLLEQTARRLRISHQCRFQPAQKDVSPFLRAIDIFVLPSVTEAFSNSLMEAMASGCAAIASEVGGNPELIQHRETGLLFRTEDVSDLTEQLQLLIKNPLLRRTLSINATELIRRRFTIEQSARNMGEIYGKFLEN